MTKSELPWGEESGAPACRVLRGIAMRRRDSNTCPQDSSGSSQRRRSCALARASALPQQADHLPRPMNHLLSARSGPSPRRVKVRTITATDGEVEQRHGQSAAWDRQTLSKPVVAAVAPKFNDVNRTAASSTRACQLCEGRRNKWPRRGRGSSVRQRVRQLSAGRCSNNDRHHTARRHGRVLRRRAQSRR